MCARVMTDSAFSLLLIWAGLRLPAWVGERQLDQILVNETTTRGRWVRAFAPIGRALGWVKESGFPVFDEQGYYAGYLPKDARRPHTAFRSPLYWESPYRYRLMMEHMPVAVMHCRLTEHIPIERNRTTSQGRDFVVVESNVVAQQMFRGDESAAGMTVGQRWPQLLRNHPVFFEKLAHLKKGEPCTYTSWFPTLGMSLELRAVYLGEENFMIIARDVTDMKAYRSEVLRLYEQMNGRLAQRELSHRGFLDASDRFVAHASEGLYSPYDALMDIFAEEKMPADLWLRARPVFEQLQYTMDRLRRFAQVSSLDFTPQLVDTAQVVNELLSDIYNVDKGIAYTKGPLPGTTAAPQVVRTLLRNMLEVMSRFTPRVTGSVIETGVRNDNLDMVYYVNVAGCRPLDLASSPVSGLMFTEGAAALQFGICQRLAYLHGGEVRLVRPGPDVLEIQATLGTQMSITTPMAFPQPRFDETDEQDSHAA
ncbi:hypothetical protein G3A43_08610 [Paraburkholderia aspalathi]|nr:hypothetical protein [Paraburkholderia aspalathi]MBK3780318.1 hypothetical protein [Paraburkholderia aspalathi]